MEREPRWHRGWYKLYRSIDLLSEDPRSLANVCCTRVCVLMVRLGAHAFLHSCTREERGGWVGCKGSIICGDERGRP